MLKLLLAKAYSTSALPAAKPTPHGRRVSGQTVVAASSPCRTFPKSAACWQKGVLLTDPRFPVYVEALYGVFAKHRTSTIVRGRPSRTLATLTALWPKPMPASRGE